MSGQLVGAVLDNAMTRSSTAMLVLVAIADRAQADGGGAWPSLKDLARRTRLDRRSVIRALAELERAGDLHVERRPQKSSRYTVTVSSDRESLGDTASPGDRESLGVVTESHPGGDTQSSGGDSLTAGGDRVSPEPSVTGGESKRESPRARPRAGASLSSTNGTGETPTAEVLRAQGAHRDGRGQWWIFDNATSESRLVHDEGAS